MFFLAGTPTFDGGVFALMICLVLLSGFFSMSETVFSSVSIPKLKVAVEDRLSGSKLSLRCTEKFDRTLTTLLIGNNIVNIALATISVNFFVRLAISEAYVSLVSTLVITLIVLIFGEILPKTFGKAYSEQISYKIAPIIYALTIILIPLSYLFMKLQNIIGKHKVEEVSVDEDELEAILDTMETEGAIKSNEVNIIRNAIDIEDSIEEIKAIMIKNRLSRVPIYKEDKDHIIGVLYERDFYVSLINNNGKDVDILSVMKPVKYVSKTMSVGVLINELKKSKTHISIVSGEYNDTLGLVTMEDALEELVGEIYDEHDKIVGDDELIKKIDDKTYLVSGEMYIEDLYEELEIGEPDPSAATKVSGFIYESTEELPYIGYVLNTYSEYTSLNETADSYKDYCKKITFEVIDITKRRINKVKVSIEDVSESDMEVIRKKEKENKD